MSTLAAPFSHPSHCAECAYDLRATTDTRTSRCPECGADLNPDAVAAARERGFFRTVAIWLSVIMTAGIALSLLAMFVFEEYALVLAPAAIFLLAPPAPMLVAIYCKRCLPDERP